MKMVGILFVALVAGVVAATVSLGSGGSLWAAVVTYFAAGTVATFLGLIAVIWRAWAAEQPTSKLALGRAAPAGK